jgi:membrane-bound lytic murein transglycosylase C
MKKISILLAFVAFGLFAQTSEEFAQEQKNAFESYKNAQEDEFDEYKREQTRAFAQYKNEIEQIWEDPKMSTKKKWLSYSEDKKTRSDVDFENEIIIIETIAASPEEAKRNLQEALEKVVTVDTKTVQENDPLQMRLDRIKKPAEMADARVKAEPILSTVVFEREPSEKVVKEYVGKRVSIETIQVSPSLKIEHSKIFSVSVKMPSDAMVKRSKVYRDEIKKQAREQKLPVSLVFAVMHTESNFNPRARSYVSAYGLMQLVPKTAGVDSYQYLYNEKKLVSDRYLYNSENNIKMGTAYLHILYYRYLAKIKNPLSRTHCAIAAYNTGAGNIAYAFTKTRNMNMAAPIINQLTPDEVYARLLKDLRWEEPKTYLKNVTKRMSAYRELYES